MKKEGKSDSTMDRNKLLLKYVEKSEGMRKMKIKERKNENEGTE